MIEISVCLIVKNEEKNLSNCLNSVLSFADEIIIADTGSTDKTIEIAKNYTNQVYKIWWQNDFSKARNYTFNKAKKDFILWLDADDIITEDNQKKIIELKSTLTTKTDMVLMKYVNAINKNGEATSFFYRERLIKNSPNLRWIGFLHEVIPIQGNFIFKDITINHNKDKNKPYTKRNLNIYRLALKEGRIFTNRDYYYYGRELYYHKFYKKSISILKKFVKEEKNNTADIFEANLIIGECYVFQKNYSKALYFYFENLKNFIPSSKLFCKIGDVFFYQNLLQQAIYWYKLAISNANSSSHIFIDKDFETLIPYLQLCVCSYQNGDLISAKNYNLLAEKSSPNHPSVIHNKKLFENLKI